MSYSVKFFSCSIIFILAVNIAFAQKKSNTDTLIAAAPQYNTSSFHQWLWGKNYRKEWSTPVNVKAIDLNNFQGGLTATKEGGGHQTRTLHVETKDEKQYALRSVNKTLGKVLPKEFQNTFIEAIVNDKVSMSHPYGAAAVPGMAQSAHIFHTNPQCVFLPTQPSLDTFNKKYGNNLYLFEQRVSGDWKDANNLGNFSKFLSTEKLLEKLYDDNDNQVDQKAFVRARLFDMFINDWDRHEDQWGWGEVEDKDKKLYVPVPQDRDQAFFSFDGKLLKFLISASGMKYFQRFKNDIPDVTNFNFEERDLDRFFANKMTLNDWQNAAKELQQSLTDDVIESSVKNMPSNIYAISGKQIVETLKARRKHIEEYATKYYKFIAKQVDIVGSMSSEHFDIKRNNNNETSINIYKINKQGERKDKPFYSRTFTADETKEIRLYGLSGSDSYTVDGAVDHPIRLRLIAGNEKDSLTIAGSGKVHVYDDNNNDNVFNTTSGTRLHLKTDTATHAFHYRNYMYSKHGFKPTFFYSDEDRFFVGLGYGLLHYKWRKQPYQYKQDLSLHYSLSETAYSLTYNGLFPQFIGKTDLALVGNYDAVRWTNFYGLGNETPFPIKDADFNRTRTEQWLASAGLIRQIKSNTFRLNALFQSIRVINDRERFIAKNYLALDPSAFNTNTFAGGQFVYDFFDVNDRSVPTKGIAFTGSAAYLQNLKDNSKDVGTFQGHLQFYVPLVSKFSLAIRAGAATVTGNPEFYQYASVGGGFTLRGFNRDRFWGKTSFYNSNEFRFISDVKSYYFNGKAGLLAFVDDGRVWLPSEKSNIMHVGYGAGILLAPFNKILADITYGLSNDDKLIQFRFTKSF